MPPKRPLEENPPSASASDEESEEDSEEEQEAPKPIQSSTKSIPPKPPSSSDDEDDDEEDEEEDGEEQKAKPTADDDNEEEDNADEDSESGSGSESESDNEPVKHMIAPRTAEVKPISSKPMSDIPKSKKPTSTNTAPAKPKRPAEEENDQKRKKKKVVDIEDGGDEESQKKGEEKKQLFQRVWTNEDEIILLNSLKDFKREGHNAANDMAGFLDFVKDSLHIDVTKAQLANKIQRLEKKFKNNASRSKEPGKDPVISKPHEWKSYQLSKEIWAEQSGKDNGEETYNAGGEVGVAERKRRRTQVKNNGLASPKRKVAKPVKSPKVEHMKEEIEEDNANAKEDDDAGGTTEYPYLNQSMQILNHPVLPVPPQGLVGLFANKVWDLIGTSKAEAFDQKWKALLIAETKAYLQHIDVVRDQTKLMLEMLESSDV